MTTLTLLVSRLELVSVYHLVNEGMVHEVRAPDAQIENINLFQDGVVESIQEP